MKTVGVRALTRRLVEYLRELRLGATILVSDRGKVVAEFSPPGQCVRDPAEPPSLISMARRGLVTLGTPGSGAMYKASPRLRHGVRSASQRLNEERSSR